MRLSFGLGKLSTDGGARYPKQMLDTNTIRKRGRPKCSKNKNKQSMKTAWHYICHEKK
jgi:hypothetical protein